MWPFSCQIVAFNAFCKALFPTRIFILVVALNNYFIYKGVNPHMLKAGVHEKQ